MVQEHGTCANFAHGAKIEIKKIVHWEESGATFEVFIEIL